PYDTPVYHWEEAEKSGLSLGGSRGIWLLFLISIKIPRLRSQALSARNDRPYIRVKIPRLRSQALSARNDMIGWLERFRGR
nr:hypothetical protein [Armatimonadota bacterium]